MVDGERFDEVRDMLEEGEVPYLSLRIVWAYDKDGKAHTHTEISKEASIDTAIGALEVAKFKMLQRNFGRKRD